MLKPTTFAEYAAGFPGAVQERLEAVRATVRAAAPDATEGISYGMPAYKLHGALVFFAAWAHHIGFYPSGSGMEAFREELAPYKSAKGSVQLPLEERLPLELIGRIVAYRVGENERKAAGKK